MGNQWRSFNLSETYHFFPLNLNIIEPQKLTTINNFSCILKSLVLYWTHQKKLQIKFFKTPRYLINILASIKASNKRKKLLDLVVFLIVEVFTLVPQLRCSVVGESGKRQGLKVELKFYKGLKIYEIIFKIS